MKNISGAMQTYIEGHGVQALATFWVITRADGTLIGFTDCDQTVTANGLTYATTPGWTRSAVQQRVDLAPANHEVVGIVTTGIITDEDIRAGKFNQATVGCFLAVPTDTDFLAYGRIILPGSYIGAITLKDGLYQMEVRGLSYLLQQSYVEVYVPSCRANFCDTRCTLNAANYSTTIEVTGVENNAAFDYSLAEGAVLPAAYGTSVVDNGPGGDLSFTYGTVTWLTGANAGATEEVSADGGTAMNLYLPTVSNIVVGDTATATMGCSKTLYACVAYNNVANMRGEPFIPGLSFLFDYGETEP